MQIVVESNLLILRRVEVGIFTTAKTSVAKTEQTTDCSESYLLWWSILWLSHIDHIHIGLSCRRNVKKTELRDFIDEYALAGVASGFFLLAADAYASAGPAFLLADEYSAGQCHCFPSAYRGDRGHNVEY